MIGDNMTFMQYHYWKIFTSTCHIVAAETLYNLVTVWCRNGAAASPKSIQQTSPWEHIYDVLVYPCEQIIVYVHPIWHCAVEDILLYWAAPWGHQTMLTVTLPHYSVITERMCTNMCILWRHRYACRITGPSSWGWGGVGCTLYCWELWGVPCC